MIWRISKDWNDDNGQEIWLLSVQESWKEVLRIFTYRYTCASCVFLFLLLLFFMVIFSYFWFFFHFSSNCEKKKSLFFSPYLLASYNKRQGYFLSQSYNNWIKRETGWKNKGYIPFCCSCIYLGKILSFCIAIR